MIRGLVIFLLCISSSAQAQSKTTEVRIDDMILDILDEGLSTRAAMGFTYYSSQPWTNGIIPVKFDTTVDSSRRQIFMNQCARWSAVAKVKCIVRSTEAVYLLVTRSDQNACYAHVGMGSNSSKRVFNFGLDWCWSDWAVLHDLGHTLGLIHEHQRADRDTYVEVIPQNIQSGYEWNFIKVGSSNDLLTTYDFISIMQYPSYSYAKPGTKVIMARPAYASYQQYLDIQPTELSSGDGAALRLIYGAP